MNRSWTPVALFLRRYSQTIGLCVACVFQGPNRLVLEASGGLVANTAKPRVPLRWLTLHDAAQVLGLSSAALRKQLERRARRASDGGIEANIDGVRARKFGKLWRVSFGEGWTG